MIWSRWPARAQARPLRQAMPWPPRRRPTPARRGAPPAPPRDLLTKRPRARIPRAQGTLIRELRQRSVPSVPKARIPRAHRVPRAHRRARGMHPPRPHPPCPSPPTATRRQRRRGLWVGTATRKQRRRGLWVARNLGTLIRDSHAQIEASRRPSAAHRAAACLRAPRLTVTATVTCPAFAVAVMVVMRHGHSNARSRCQRPGLAWAYR